MSTSSRAARTGRRARVESAQRHLAFLAEASRVLGSSLEYEATLANVAQLVVPELAPWCAVYVLDELGDLRRLVSSHADPRKRDLMRELDRRFPVSASPDHPVRLAIATGQTILTEEIAADDITQFATDEEHARILRELGTTQALVVPLIARKETVGAMSFGAPADAGYTSEMRVIAEDLAGRAAVAIDNARLYHEAQEAVRLRDEFLATASHDLKTPLTAISGQAQLLRRRAQRLPPPEGEQIASGLTKVCDVADRMTAIINELIDVATLRMGRPISLDRRPTDLVVIASWMVAETQVVTRAHEIRLEAAVPELIGSWDGFRLERVLGNLLSNAVKYSPNGGEIVVRVWREDEEPPSAGLSVTDHGIGIPRADLPRIFRRFHRGANVTGRIRGSGIGLAGARAIVERHGGTISVKSKEGEGSTFTVRLPLDQPASGG